MKNLSSKKRSLSVLAAATAFLVIVLALFGLNLSIALMSSGEMPNCQFMQEEASMCPMNLIDHIQTWQQTMAGIITEVLTLGAVFFALFLIAKFSPTTFNLDTQSDYFYRKRDHLLRYIIPLRLAFARGIINPKIY